MIKLIYKFIKEQVAFTSKKKKKKKKEQVAFSTCNDVKFKF